jgi:hypothetical protein
VRIKLSLGGTKLCKRVPQSPDVHRATQAIWLSGKAAPRGRLTLSRYNCEPGAAAADSSEPWE